MHPQSRRRVPPALTGPAWDPPPQPGDPRVKRYRLRRVDLEAPRQLHPKQQARIDHLADILQTLRPDLEPVVAASLAAEAVTADSLPSVRDLDPGRRCWYGLPQPKSLTDRIADFLQEMRPDLEPVLVESYAAEAADPERIWRETRQREIRRDPNAARELPRREPTVAELDPDRRWQQVRERVMAAHRGRWAVRPMRPYTERRMAELATARERPGDWRGTSRLTPAQQARSTRERLHSWDIEARHQSATRVPRQVWQVRERDYGDVLEIGGLEVR